MKSNKKNRSTLSALARLICVTALVFLSSYCTDPEKQTKIVPLSADERYLVDTYVRISHAQEMHAISAVKSDSLFAWMDSTTDTSRVARTIRGLNQDPDRWLVIFTAIEKDLEEPTGEDNSEQSR